MTEASGEAQYTLKAIRELLGLSRTVLSGLIAAGFVAPTPGPGRERRFSFQDLMLLRTAFELQQANVPPRKILRALKKLRAELPDELPLTGLRISAVGADVAVRDRKGSWRPDTRQLLFDFEVADVDGTVAFLPDATSGSSAKEWFERGITLEKSNPAAAIEAYRRALEIDPAYTDAYLNLGAFLCENKRSLEALQLYEKALQPDTGDPRIYFNLAIALEDQDEKRMAVNAYESALALDEHFADAHFNLGVLLESMGDAQGALRHFSAYRRSRRQR